MRRDFRLEPLSLPGRGSTHRALCSVREGGNGDDTVRGSRAHEGLSFPGRADRGSGVGHLDTCRSSERKQRKKKPMKPNLVALLSLTALVGGCASKPQAPAATGGRAAPGELTLQSSGPAGENPGRSNIALAQDILTACGIARADAYFAFDSARVDPRARKILGKVSECFSGGPLAKRSMRLVGHAEPRGDQEYNLLLGGRRAEAVRGVFVELGLAGSRISTTSRGEMDATGTDAQSWSQDRRVDVLLGA